MVQAAWAAASVPGPSRGSHAAVALKLQNPSSATGEGITCGSSVSVSLCRSWRTSQSIVGGSYAPAPSLPVTLEASVEAYAWQIMALTYKENVVLLRRPLTLNLSLSPVAGASRRAALRALLLLLTLRRARKYGLAGSAARPQRLRPNTRQRRRPGKAKAGGVAHDVLAACLSDHESAKMFCTITVCDMIPCTGRCCEPWTGAVYLSCPLALGMMHAVNRLSKTLHARENSTTC